MSMFTILSCGKPLVSSHGQHTYKGSYRSAGNRMLESEDARISNSQEGAQGFIYVRA